MSEVRERDLAATLGSAEPSGCSPITTEDGRPFVRQGEGNEHSALWLPDPPRDGDPVYCAGVRVGTFHGQYREPGGWYVETVSTGEMPPELAARLSTLHPQR